jgi:hypothetical protein
MVNELGDTERECATKGSRSYHFSERLLQEMHFHSCFLLNQTVVKVWGIELSFQRKGYAKIQLLRAFWHKSLIIHLLHFACAVCLCACACLARDLSAQLARIVVYLSP